jgi:hypothetical protein
MQGNIFGASPIGVIEIVLEKLFEDHEMLELIEVVLNGHEAAFVGVTVDLINLSSLIKSREWSR